MNSSSFSIFGIPIGLTSKETLRGTIRRWLSKRTFHRIATVGPEFLLRARSSKQFHTNLLQADLCVADGVGVTIAGWLFGKRIERFPGADLLLEILREAERRHLSVFLAVRKDSLSSLDEIQTALLKECPTLKVYGFEFEKRTTLHSLPAPHSQFLTHHATIVFCNFGAPGQEYFLESLRGRGKHVRLAMGVGGAFDFLTGKLPRAPRVFQYIGLEWLWRFLLQPSRFRRIWNAIVMFPCFIVIDRLGKNQK